MNRRHAAVTPRTAPPPSAREAEAIPRTTADPRLTSREGMLNCPGGTLTRGRGLEPERAEDERSGYQ